MRVALIKPCWHYPIAGADHTYHRRWPPLELLNCAAILQDRGHEVTLVDAQALDLSPEETATRVGRVDLALVTSSALDRWQCPTLELAPLVATMRALRPCTERLLLTGFHGTVHPEAMLDMTGADAVIRGEPEWTLRDVADGRPWDQTPGLTFRRAGKIIATEDRPPLEMTDLPPPALGLLDLRRYNYEILGPRLVVLEGSRGCPYPCTFCSRVIQGRKLRRKGVEQLGREVEMAIGHGARNIYFIDLEFTASADLVRGLCELILRRGLKVRWCCQTRSDQVDEPLLRQMYAAGCRLVHFGVESASPRIAEMSQKRIPLDAHRAALAAARRVGMETLGFFLLGYPGETEEEMRETIALARQLNPTYASFHRISPYPGTAIHERYAADAGELFPAFAGSDEQRRLADRLVREALWSYYVRPGYVLSRLLRSSPASLWRQLRLFAGYFSSGRIAGRRTL